MQQRCVLPRWQHPIPATWTRFARALHEKFPNKPIIIAGDDDKHQELERGCNPGRVKAEEAAQAVGGKTIFPIFLPGEQASNPKSYIDFNDLANRSKLGRNGLERQLVTAVRKVLVEEEHWRRTRKLGQEQKREPRVEQRSRRLARMG